MAEVIQGAPGAINIPTLTGAEQVEILTGAVKTVTTAAAIAASSPSGTFTANGATAVVVGNTNVTANSTIDFGLKTVGGTPAGAPFVSSVTPGVGFSVKAAAGDTSVYNYRIVG